MQQAQPKSKPARSIKLVMSGEMHENLRELARVAGSTENQVALHLMETGLAFLLAEQEADAREAELKALEAAESI